MDLNKKHRRNPKSRDGSTADGSGDASPNPSVVRERAHKPRHTHFINQNPEKVPSIEDAVYVYAALRQNGTSPPLFLQRNLSYLNRPKRAPFKDLDVIIEALNSIVDCRHRVKFNMCELRNLQVGHQPLTAYIDFKVYLQKSCYKRRKTDITVKEKEILSFRLGFPHTFITSKHNIQLDLDEVTSSLGAHHLSSSSLKIVATVCSEKRVKPTAVGGNRRFKKKAVEAEPNFKTSVFASSLLLYSGGKTYINADTKHTLYLQPYTSGSGCIPQYMEWDELSKFPQVTLETKMMNNKRACSSPQKSSANAIPPQLSASRAVPHTLSDQTQGLNINEGSTAMIEKPSKLYLVLQYKGSPQTTVQSGYNCPFCLQKTKPAELVYLLKHFRLCHDRLLFLYKESENSVFITINPHYDGSYVGNPIRDITSYIKPPKDRKEPERRYPFTEIINLRCSNKPVTVEEFTRPEPLATSYSVALMGHNRLYYHSVSNQTVLANDFDYDSDGDDFDWTRTASAKLIDEFIDVNKGEKELMKLWNQFMSLNPQYIADCQIEDACIEFVRQNNPVISMKLRNNFLCHLATLYDCGVITPNQIQSIMKTLLPNASAVSNYNGFHQH